MARTALTPQQISRSMLTPAYSAGDAANGHAYTNSGQEFLIVKTTGTGATLTVKNPQVIDGQTVADRTYVLPATGERQIGPFPVYYNQADGNVYIDLSSATGLTLGVFRST
jgi:hypothetical protein